MMFDLWFGHEQHLPPSVEKAIKKAFNLEAEKTVVFYVCLDVFSISSTRFHVCIEGRMLAETKVRPIPEVNSQATEIVSLDKKTQLAKLVLEIRRDRKEEKVMEIEKRQTGRESASVERTYRLRYDIHQMDRLIGLLNQSLATNTCVCVCAFDHYIISGYQAIASFGDVASNYTTCFACLEIIKSPFGAWKNN